MERLRERTYWALDALRGRPVGAYYQEVREAYERGVAPQETAEKLDRLLRHAVDTTAFYRARFGDGPLRLEAFPVMDKQTYLRNDAACKSTAYLHAADNRVMYTSGSTGTPFAVVQNRDKILRNTASALFINSLGGYRLGDRQAFLRVWVRACQKSPLRQRMENLFPVDTAGLDDENLARICAFLRKKRITSIVGYASSLAALAAYIRENRVDMAPCGVRSVIAISEHLPQPARRLLEEVFRCPVNSQYSNEENGIMAIQEGGEAYYVDSSSWHIELLKMDTDEPAADGELGRVVITDLYNYAMPMIRYDNGDTAVAEHRVDSRSGRYRLYFRELYGRRSDVVYDLAGNPVSPHAISIQMWGMQDVRQWKFVQRGAQDYCFYLNGGREADAEALRARFSPLFGANIAVEFVDEIPVLASGKRKYIECLGK